MSQRKKTVDPIVAAYNAGNLAEAERQCRLVLEQRPNDMHALRLLGISLRKLDPPRLNEARQVLENAVQVHPQSGLMQFELGNLYIDLHLQREAYTAFQTAIQLQPDLQQAYVNLSAVTEEQERFDEALDWARKALNLNPHCALGHYNAANSLREMGRLQEAVQHYELSTKYNPDFPKAPWNLGICHLLLGNYREGWKEFEMRESAGEVRLDHYRQPAWDGSSLQDKTILVHAEQGIGDEVIFASCYPDLLPLAKHCILVCEPRLEKLFRRSFPTATVYPWLRLKDFSPAPVPQHCDFQVPAGSLPFHLRTTRESFPQRDSFLIPDPKLVESWHQKFAALGSGYKIGISWRAGGKPVERRKRSIPLADWKQILAVPGVQFINLQYSDADDELAALEAETGIKIHDWEQGDPLIDMDEYAAKIAALDLVISVGNATVHMAGALGKPAWAMLPRIPSWRWMAHGDYSPWYTSVRLFRQPVRGQWQPVLSEIAGLLQHSVQGGEQVPVEPAVIKVGSPQQTSAATPMSAKEEWLPVTDTSHIGSLEQLPAIVEQADAALHAHNYAEAERLYRLVIQLQPRHPLALYGLGLMARATGRKELAIRSFQRSLAIYEPLSDHHYQLGCALYEADRWDEAERSLLRAIELAPQNAEALTLLGVMCHQDQRWDDAAQHLAHAIKVQPRFAPAHSNLGRLMLDTGHLEEAIVCFQRALGVDDQHYDAIYHLGVSYERLGQFTAARRAYESALTVRPENSDTLLRLSSILATTGAAEEALQCLDNAISLHPGNAQIHLLRAQTLIQAEEVSLGWQEYEWRRKLPSQQRFHQAFQKAEWTGESLTDRTIVIHGEQCLGDEIVYATCYPDVLEQAQQTTITCEPRLQKLFARSFPAAIVQGVPRGQESTWQAPPGMKIDRQIAAGSLPRILRNKAQQFPQRDQLLLPDPSLVAQWKDQLQSWGDGLKVGISWRGGERIEDQQLRSIPLLEWRTLLECESVQFVSLQHGDVRKELAAAQAAGLRVRSHHGLNPAGDLDDLAALIAALDVVISVGNTNVHLAGALGTPTVALMPKQPGWRWLAADDRTPWYSSVRLFRQTRLGRWLEPLNQARQFLLNFADCATEFHERRPVVPSSVNGPHWAAQAQREQR